MEENDNALKWPYLTFQEDANEEIQQINNQQDNEPYNNQQLTEKISETKEEFKSQSKLKHSPRVVQLFEHTWINNDNSGLERPSRHEVEVANGWVIIKNSTAGKFYYNEATRTCCWTQPYIIPEGVTPEEHIPPLGVFSRKRKKRSKEDLTEENEDDGFERKRWKRKKEEGQELTPDGKTPVSFLQEYCINVLKCTPKYEHSIQEDPLKPFVTKVIIKGDVYGIGAYVNKRQSKQLAAENTLESLCPGVYPSTTRIVNDELKQKEMNILVKSKHELSIDDERILMLNQVDKSPAQILQEYCNREALTIEWEGTEIGDPDDSNRFEIRAVLQDGLVGIATGRTKKEAKQRVSLKLLKAIHPDVSTWTELLSLYAPKQFDKSTFPTYQLFSTLKEEMRKVIPLHFDGEEHFLNFNTMNYYQPSGSSDRDIKIIKRKF